MELLIEELNDALEDAIHNAVHFVAAREGHILNIQYSPSESLEIKIEKVEK